MNINKEMILIGILLILSLFCMGIVSADINLDDDIVISVDNEYYLFPSGGLVFDMVAINESGSWVRFNDTGFNVTSPGHINITLSYLNADVLSADSSDPVLTFTADTLTGTVWFNLSGFKTTADYTLYIDDDVDDVYTSDGDGVVSFMYDSWSEHTFELRDGDLTSTNISNVFPADDSTEVSRPPVNLSAYINGSDLTVYFYFVNMTPTSPTWTLITTEEDITNERVEYTTLSSFGRGTEFVWGNTEYTWSVNVTDGESWVNQSFTYTTLASASGDDARLDVDNNNVVFTSDLNLVWSGRSMDYDALLDVDGNGVVFTSDLNMIWAGRS